LTDGGGVCAGAVALGSDGAGANSNLTVTAKDASGNVTPGYTSRVHVQA
jgi:hypothetical protein